MKQKWVWLLLMGLGTTTLLVQADDYPDPDQYDWTGISVGAKVGTLGVGPEITFYLRPEVNLRASFNVLNWNTTRTIDDIDYEVKFDYTSALALVDWFPFSARSFHVTVGAAYLDGGIDLAETPTGPVTLGNNTYAASDVGTITSSFTPDSLAPYIGIGFGNPVRPDQAWSFSFDLGVFVQNADVVIEADSPLSGDAQFEADLEIERTSIEEDLDQFNVYPVITFTVAYHF